MQGPAALPCRGAKTVEGKQNLFLADSGKLKMGILPVRPAGKADAIEGTLLPAPAKHAHTQLLCMCVGGLLCACRWQHFAAGTRSSRSDCGNS